MKKLFLPLLALCALGLSTQAKTMELRLYHTDFMDWADASSSTTPATHKDSTRYSKEQLDISFAEVQIDADGANSKFTNTEVVTPGYAVAAKSATPYIETTILKQVTKVEYVHAATGNSRGWGLMCRTQGATKWDTISTTFATQTGSLIQVAVNRDSVQLRWYNLNAVQNAYMLEMNIYGNVEVAEDFVPDITLTYYNQDGVRLGTEEIAPNQPLKMKYSVDNLTIPEGFAFRGWKNSKGIRIEEGDTLTEDTKLFAEVTAIEKATMGNFFTYNLNSPSFYPDEHECLILNNGLYIPQHGTMVPKGDTLSLITAGQSYIKIASSTSSSQASTTKGEYYSKDTVHIIFADTTYLFSVTIYNVQSPLEQNQYGYWEIPANNGASLLLALQMAQDSDYIFLPNGTYDLSTLCLTPVSKKHLSIIGESMTGTIIRNRALTPGISSTATLLITGNETYLQDLTIQNLYDYYATNDGQAVTIQDKASKTICKNVRLLSYQDTYYSNKIGAIRYFEDCEIHGTVDFICGDGTVFFQNTLLYGEKRYGNKAGGSIALTASNADQSDKGYIFHDCRIQSLCPTVSLGRSWNNYPQCAFISTTIDPSAGTFSLTESGKINRWTLEAMNALPQRFAEYNTMDTLGAIISPASCNLHFTLKTNSKDMETILTAQEAEQYSYASIFNTTWDPALDCQQNYLYYQDNEGSIVWDKEDAELFLVRNGDILTFTTELPETLTKDMTVRAANSRGGFGPAARLGDRSMANPSVLAPSATNYKILRNGQIMIVRQNQLFDLLGNTLP